MPTSESASACMAAQAWQFVRRKVIPLAPLVSKSSWKSAGGRQYLNEGRSRAESTSSERRERGKGKGERGPRSWRLLWGLHNVHPALLWPVMLPLSVPETPPLRRSAILNSVRSSLAALFPPTFSTSLRRPYTSLLSCLESSLPVSNLPARPPPLRPSPHLSPPPRSLSGRERVLERGYGYRDYSAPFECATGRRRVDWRLCRMVGVAGMTHRGWTRQSEREHLGVGS